MNPRDTDPLTVPEDEPRCIHGWPLWACPLTTTNALLHPDPERFVTIRDRPGITIPLLLAIVVVVVVALAVWGGTRP